MPPAVALGAISYGVYLWHWPFTVWFGVADASGLGRVVRWLLVVGLTLAVSALSYRFVEQPIRNGWVGRRLSPRRMAFAVPAAVLAVSACAVAATETSVPSGTPLVMLAGDSVPRKLAPTIERRAELRGWAVVDTAAGGCSVTADRIVTSKGRPLASGEVCPQRIPGRQAVGLARTPMWSCGGTASPSPTGSPLKAGTSERAPTRSGGLRKRSLKTHVERLTANGAKVVFVAAEPPGEGIWTRCSTEKCHEWIRRQIDRYDDLTSRWNDMVRRYAQRHPDKAVYVSITDTVCHDQAVPCDDARGGKRAAATARTTAVRAALSPPRRCSTSWRRC